jgi:hypothetical protein
MKLAIYDSKGDLLGYRSNINWDISPKPQNYNFKKLDSEMKTALRLNYLEILRPIKEVYIVAETNEGNPIIGYHLKRQGRDLLLPLWLEQRLYSNIEHKNTLSTMVQKGTRLADETPLLINNNWVKFMNQNLF